MQGVYLDDCWHWVGSWNATEVPGFCSGCLPKLFLSAACPLQVLFWWQCWSQQHLKAQPSNFWVRDDLLFSHHLRVVSPLWDGYPLPLSHACSLSQSSSVTHCLLAPPVDSSGHQSIYLSSPNGMSAEMGVGGRFSGTCDIATIFPIGLYTSISIGCVQAH